MRSNGEGGSLCTAIHEKMNPVYVSCGENDIEILVVQAEFSDKKCRFINAYGPQEGADRSHILEFYSKLDQEIKNAKILECLIFLEMDANAKLGCDIIPGDPHTLSSNGEYLLDIIQSNNLVILNADEKCEGLFTRERKTVTNHEKSIIDYAIICQEMYLFFVKMKIDSENALCKYQMKKNKMLVTKSYHNLLVCSFNISIRNKFHKNYSNRRQTFNLKDPEGWSRFKKTHLWGHIKKLYQRAECTGRGKDLAEKI